MDSRLLKAAQLGDVALLNELLEEDPYILEKSALAPTAETPLHIAVFAKKADFVREITRRMSSFALKLNQDGFSPLHIAAAIGYEDVVQKLLISEDEENKDVLTYYEHASRLCMLKDNKQGLIPLHYAAIKGEVTIIEEFLQCCPESLKERTPHGQTVLHLAIKNSQYEAFKALLEKFEGDDIKNFVDAEDKDGNKIYQMAVASNQLQVLQYLERYKKVGMASIEIIEEGSVDAMPQPKRHKKVGMAWVEKIEEGSVDAMPQPKQPKNFKGTRKVPPEMVNMMLVVASLIATVTFQGISPPDTIFKGEGDMNLAKKNCTFTTILLEKKSCPKAMRHFFVSMVFNTVGFFAASGLIMLFRWLNVAMLLVSTAVGCMMLSYIFLSKAMYPESILLVIYVSGVVFFLLAFALTKIEFICLETLREKISRGYEKKTAMETPRPTFKDTSNPEA